LVAVKITEVNCHVLLDPSCDPAATSSNQDDIVVEVETDEGITGIGETDLNAWIARACIEAPATHTMDRGLGRSIIGLHPLDPAAIWEELYMATAMTGRRGALVHALGALDLALWDICGKAAGKPTWMLLGEAAHRSLTPYASLLPNRGNDWDSFGQAFVEQASWAKRQGYRAAKLEILVTGPYAHGRLDVPDHRIVEVIRAVRGEVGADFDIMVDVAYAWQSWQRALEVIETWTEHDVYFVETPLWSDDLSGYAELARRSPIRLACGEWLATRHEFRAVIEDGLVHVVQPDVGRVGGLTEASGM
jgi:L-alanine-DL-glutamate epimerase-like enolase superfamily enzyme